MPETRGQLLYEWAHLLNKLSVRDPGRYRTLRELTVPEPHPLFRIVAGGVRSWERTGTNRQAVKAAKNDKNGTADERR
jgi:hypothetical protein